MAGLAIIGLVMVGAVLAFLGGRDARRARNDLEAAKAQLSGVSERPESLSSADGRAAAQASLRTAAASIARGRRALHHSPAFVVARFVPVVSNQRRALFQLVDDAQLAVADGTSLLAQISSSADALHIRQGGIPLDRIAALGTSAHRYGIQLAGLTRPSSGLWSQLRTAREQFNALDARLSQRLLVGGDGLAAATTFLGSVTDRHYFLALQNNAEMRDQGMVLSYGTVTAAQGHVTVGHTGRIAELTLTTAPSTPVPAGTAATFKEIGPTRLWQSVNATADFAFSGRAMVDMYRQATGSSLDGVIAVDVPGLAALLDVIGPVTVPGVATPISAANAGTVLLHDLYFADTSSSQANRVEHLGDLARGIVERITHGDVDAISLARHLATAAAGGHIKLYSAETSEEATFERSGLGGGPALTLPDRTFHLAVESRIASKVDYYVTPAVAQTVDLQPDGTARIHTAVTIADTAPAGPANEQLGPDLENRTAVGDYVAWCLLWVPAGALQADAVPESGLQVTEKVPLIHAGQTTTLSFDTIIPHAVRGGQLQLRYVPQPRLTPDDLTVTVRAPGWHLKGTPATVHAPMDRTITLTWGATR